MTTVNEDDRVERVAKAIWREDHYDPKLCAHSGDGGTSCAYCEPHDDDTPCDWPADKERAERQARAAITALQGADTVTEAMIEALTPSAATKAAYIGEFSFSIAEGEYGSRILPVPWTTIKEIMAAIRNRAAAPTAQDDNGVRIEAVWGELQCLLPQTGVGAELEAAWNKLQCLLRRSPDVPRHE